MDFQTEVPFTLPKGYLDKDGTLHREGVMRLATAADEILPMRDPRVQQNAGYLSIILLTRVIIKLGTLPVIDTKIIEGLFTADLAFLQNLYQMINTIEPMKVQAVCPACGKTYTMEIPIMGES